MSSSTSPSALSPETTKIRFQIPTLKEPALTRWPSYRQQLKNFLSNHGVKNIDAASLTDVDEALLFNCLSEGLSQTQYNFYVFINNPGCLGSLALKECDSHFRTNDTAHKLEMFRRSIDFHPSLEDCANRDSFHAWSSRFESLGNDIIATGITVHEIIAATFLSVLPSTPEWNQFTISSTATSAYRTHSLAIAAAQNFHASTLQRNNGNSAPVASALAGALLSSTGTSTRAETNTIPARGKFPQDKRAPRDIKDKCNRCGGIHPSDECRRTRDYTCRACNTKGHWEPFCSQNQQAPSNSHGTTAFTAF